MVKEGKQEGLKVHFQVSRLGSYVRGSIDYEEV